MSNSKGELKPCPFCGSKPEIVSGMEIPPTVEEYLEQEPIVKCSKVGCALRYTTVLLDEWNTRPITPKEEWISVKPEDLFELLGLANALLPDPESKRKLDALQLKYPPFPPTKDQTEKKCKNPECKNGRVNVLVHPRHAFGADAYLSEPCPDCQKDQQEERGN